MVVDELRLGNLIYWNIPKNKDVIYTIISISEDYIHTRPISLGKNIHIDYNPIPLTKELMKQFGFTFKPIGPSGSITTRHTGYWQKGGIPYFAGSRIKDQVDIFLQLGDGIDIVYVHQLQNIYYELTKQNLHLW